LLLTVIGCHLRPNLGWFVGSLVGSFVGLGPKFLDNGSQLSLSGSYQNLHTHVGSMSKTYFRKFFSQTLKIRHEKTSNLTSKQLNISTYKHQMFCLR